MTSDFGLFKVAPLYISKATLNMAKKPTVTDWHTADIIAAVRKTGTSISRLSRLNHLSSATVGQALYRPYPKCERIIATHLKTTPQEIWPSRYNEDGTTKSARGERGLGRHVSNLSPESTRSLHAKKTLKHKCSTTENACNVNDEQSVIQALAA